MLRKREAQQKWKIYRPPSHEDDHCRARRCRDANQAKPTTQKAFITLSKLRRQTRGSDPQGPGPLDQIPGQSQTHHATQASQSRVRSTVHTRINKTMSVHNALFGEG